MKHTLRLLAAAATFLGYSSVASAGCGAALDAALQTAHQAAGTLRADKPGQARIAARDGTLLSAPQAHWLAVDLRRAGAACERGDDAQAAVWLAAADDVLRAGGRL